MAGRSDPASMHGWRLVERGYRGLAVDLIGLSSSPASLASPRAQRWDLDIAAAAGLLGDRGAARIALVGANIVAIGSIVAATEIRLPVVGVVALSAQVQMSGLDGPDVARLHSRAEIRRRGCSSRSSSCSTPSEPKQDARLRSSVNASRRARATAACYGTNAVLTATSSKATSWVVPVWLFPNWMRPIAVVPSD
jgi:hypothetical protein